MHITPDAALKPDYALLRRQVESILEGERDLVANASQFAAFIYETIAELNWAGFYLTRPTRTGDGKELLVGPFQGKVACARIAFGRGVCGAAAQEGKTQLVPDVHAFPGHIACDSASNAEIVIPLIKDGAVLGVFDIDSPVLNRFSEEDQAGLESLVAAFMAATALR
ncbi:MAG: GAF domain-containing protein [Bdellovibrionales bacterium]|nr:GAF domain-containing protein [Massilia sp.]